jgi:hypothetical protein
LRIRLPEPIGYAIERVSPAYYVELRALDIAKGEAEDSTCVRYRPAVKLGSLVWPFQWPRPMESESVTLAMRASDVAPPNPIDLIM